MKKILTLIIFITLSKISFGLVLYWDGTGANKGGNWNDVTNWHTGSIMGPNPGQAPRSFDDVIFTDAGLANGADIVIDQNSNCQDLTFDAGIDVSKAITISGATNLNLDVYRNLQFVSNITMTFGGQLKFRSSSLGNTITFAGVIVPGNIVFDDDNGGWTLLDSMHTQNYWYFQRGNLNTNSQKVTCKLFWSNENTKSRTLTLGNSTIVITRKDIDNQHFERRVWQTNWTNHSVAAKNITLDAGTSTIIFDVQIGGNSWTGSANMGRSLSYHNIIFPRMGALTLQVNLRDCYVKKICSYSNIQFQENFNVDTLELGANSTTTIARQRTLTVNHLYRPLNSCNGYIYLRSNALSPTDYGTFNSPSFNLDYHIFSNIRMQPIGNTHIANNSIELTPNFDFDAINPPTPRTLYWVGGTGNLSDVAHWSTTSGGAANALCSPGPADSLVFDINSFSASTDSVYVDDNMLVGSLTFTTDVPAGTTFYLSSINISILGNLSLCPNINISLVNFSDFEMLGVDKTITANGYNSTNAFWMSFQPNAYYTFLDDFNTPNISLYFWGAKVKANKRNLRFSRIEYKSGQNALNNNANILEFDSTFVRFISNNPYNSYANIDPIFTGNTTFIFESSSNNLNLAGWDGRSCILPNIITEHTSSIFKTDLRKRSATTAFLRVMGNATFNGSADLFGNSTDMPDSIIIEGNLNLAKGRQYRLLSGPNRTFTVRDTLKAVGDCSFGINILGLSNDTIGFYANEVLIDYVSFSNIRARIPFDAANSVDVVNNSGINFVSVTPPGKRMYWRSNGTTYTGNWTDPCFWATHPDSLVGGCGCPPNENDTAVFDYLSYSNSSTSVSNRTVTISNTTNINTLIIDFTGGHSQGMRIEGLGVLNIGGSLIGDPLCDFRIDNFINFTAIDSGHIIDGNNMSIRAEIVFRNAGGHWDFVSDFLSTDQIYLQNGGLKLNGNTVKSNSLVSNYTSVRKLDLRNSRWEASRSSSSGYGWNVDNENLTFLSDSSNVVLTGSTPRMLFHALNFDTVETTNTSTVGVFSTSGGDVPLINHMVLRGPTDLSGDYIYNELYLFPGKTYRFAGNSTQTFSSPSGILNAQGEPGQFIQIESMTNGVPVNFFKDYGTPICTEWTKIKDNYAYSNDPTMVFKTGQNGDNILGSATGLWDFSKAPFVAPTVEVVESFEELNCLSPVVHIPIRFTGTGPYYLEWDSAGFTRTIVFPEYALDTFITIYNPPSYTFNLTKVQAYDCYTPVAGTVLTSKEYTTQAFVATALTHLNDSGNCYFNNNNVWKGIGSDTSGRLIVTLNDDPALDTIKLGHVSAKVNIISTPGEYQTKSYAQRIYSIRPEHNGAARVRLYLTKDELENLRIASALPTLTLPELAVTKYEDGQFLNYLGATYLPVVGSGTDSVYTSTDSVYYIEVNTPSFSDFILHVDNGTILPLALIGFGVTLENDFPKIEWSAVESRDLLYYELERTTSPNLLPTQIAKVLPKSGNNLKADYAYTDRLASEGDNWYRVALYYSNGDIHYSNYKLAQKSAFSKVKTKIYPNPANAFVNIELPTDQMAVITIYSLSGQKLKTEILSGTKYGRFELSDYKAGFYLMQVQQGNQPEMHRIKID